MSFRDRNTGVPQKHRFGIVERERESEARVLFHQWVVQHLTGTRTSRGSGMAEPPARRETDAGLLSGSLLEVASGLIESERNRSRSENEPRRRGTVTRQTFQDRSRQVHDFLEFLNERHGRGAVARLRIADLSMDDIESYNRQIVRKGLSASQVAKRLQRVKAIIDRAGRPEYGHQVLAWNWDSRDVAHGLPPRERTLPTVDQLKAMLDASDLRGKTWIWLGIGLGLGAKDLAAIHVGQITKEAYDLRRGKTGIERYGSTPPLAWSFVKKYQQSQRRQPSELLFVTRNGEPLVHEQTNAVSLWWTKLRLKIREDKTSLSGFYTLRHLGATEFGSRPGASIGDVKRWLGHSASSHMADLYMRPVKPEYREVVRWVRKQLMQRK